MSIYDTISQLLLEVEDRQVAPEDVDECDAVFLHEAGYLDDAELEAVTGPRESLPGGWTP